MTRFLNRDTQICSQSLAPSSSSFCFFKKTQSLQARIGDIAGHVLLLSEAGLNMFGASAEEPPHRHNKEREKEEIKKLLTNPPNML